MCGLERPEDSLMLCVVYRGLRTARRCVEGRSHDDSDDLTFQDKNMARRRCGPSFSAWSVWPTSLPVGHPLLSSFCSCVAPMLSITWNKEVLD